MAKKGKNKQVFFTKYIQALQTETTLQFWDMGT